MAKNSPLPLPVKGRMFQWFMQNEDAIINMVAWFNKMQALELNMVVPGGYNKGDSALIEGGDNIVLPIPSVFPNQWALATGTASRTTFVTSSVTLPVLAQKVMALQEDAIATGMMRTS